VVRLNFIVEGHAEEAFVNQILCPHLGGHDVVCAARRVEFSRRRGVIYRGGLIDWSKAARDIDRWRREDANADTRFTTMFDLYKLPNEAPGRSEAANLTDPFSKVHAIEQAVNATVNDQRFLPYVQLHEFEALLFAGADKLAVFYPERSAEAQQLVDVSTQHPSPEHIDEGATTAPSKRIIARIPEYEGGKLTASPIVLERIGLTTLRQRCPHFGAWLTCLESLATPNPLPWPRLVAMPSPSPNPET
jgi:hypothetical protein